MADPRIHSAHQRRRRAIKRRVMAAGAVVVVGVGAGVGIAAAQASGGPGYRTAVASTGDAVRTITVSGTVQPVNQAQASFQVSGTVTSVNVGVGQQVTAGQTLATLDTTSLQEQVSLAQATLATAQARLNQDESGQATTAAETSGSNVQAAVLTSASTGSGGTANLAQAQQAVVTAQHSADLDIQSAATALASAESECSSSATTTPPTTSPTTTPPTTTPPTTTPPSSTSTSNPSGGSGGSVTSAACTSALQQAYAVEQQVSRDQQNVQNAEKTLAGILSTLSSSAAPNTTKPSTGSTSAKPSTSSNAGGASSSSTATNSAAQLATDQAAIDNDQASLVQAQQSLSNATLTAPISGTVGSLNLSPGQAVTAGSTSSYITVTNAGGYQATASLSTAQVGLVAVGDTAHVAVDGSSGTVSGTVTRVGPVTVASSSYTYPMIVSISGTNGGKIAGGSAAQVQVQVASADNTLVVPTSAVHTTGPGRSYVVVLQGDQQVRKTVTTGVVGQLKTQIRSGLSSGTVVVLADPSQAVPSSSTNSATTFGRGFGGFGGAGFGGGAGGFGGGGVTRAGASGG
ncbi:MAG TPA: HlyD family efflux transporter periplasmic adaptor subunit [Acidimicrobiales bacterium]|nr:HlyD family efflux transporter periplasmic adaptor subunit [Acidimicrobiales bacterium]